MKILILLAGLASGSPLPLSEAPDDFARITAPPEFTFPEDHGPHPAYRSEWWYVTGNLATESGRPFGFQFTVFRFGLAPGPAPADSPWRTHQAWMAHLALTDVAGGRFHAGERFQRGVQGLAGARADPFSVWLDDWRFHATGSAAFPARLEAADEGFSLDLELDPVRPPVLQGRDGYSRKGPEPGNASAYFSLPRLAARGRVRIDGEWHRVEGEAWLDREWGTSALGPDRSGWDWFAFQFERGGEFMFYRLREAGGGAAPESAGVLVEPDGRVVRLDADDVVLEPRRWWTSEQTGSRYPVAWTVRVPGRNARFEVTPRLDRQEHTGRFRYWEGAVEVTGTRDGQPVGGHGYVELVGYPASPANAE